MSIARGYQAGSVKRQFTDIRVLRPLKSRISKVKSNEMRKINSFTIYNTSLSNMNVLVKR